MTDHDLPDSPEAFDALDRRAAAAIADLDRSVDASAVPDFEAPTETNRRALPAIAIAAGLVVLALVAAAVVFTGGDDEQSTVANEGEFTRLVLHDPGTIGYEIAAAFDGSDAEEAPAEGDGFASIEATVYGPAESDDAWSEAVVSYSLPSDVTTLGGRPVDIGGPEASIEDSGIGLTIGWSDGDRVRYLVSTRADEPALVDLARAMVATNGLDAIDGQRVLFSGKLSDVFPSLLTMIARGADPFAGYRSAAVFYGLENGDGEGGMVVATSAGSDAALRAHSVVALDARDVSVRGRPGVFAEFVGDDEIGMFHIAWLEDPQTLVRVDALGVGEDELLDQLERLESVDAETFAAIVAEHSVDDPFDDGATSETFEETGEPIAPTTTGTDGGEPRAELASVDVEEESVTFRAAILGAPDGPFQLKAVEEDLNGESGVGQGLGSTSENAVLRSVGANVERVLVAGVVGPDAVDIAIVDTETGERVSETDPTAIGPSTATIPDSDRVLFLAVLDAEYVDRDLAIVATLADGSEITLEALAS